MPVNVRPHSHIYIYIYVYIYYADDLTRLANTPAKAEYLLHRQERVEGGIKLYEDRNKANFMYFKLEGAIS